MRFLFHCRNTTGLGHLMRGRNIAREIRKIAPSAEILFTGNDKSVVSLSGEFPYAPDLNFENLAFFRPDVVVFDTLFPEWTKTQVPASNIRMVYVMRKIRPERRDDFFGHPLFARMDLILIPHTREDFSDGLPVCVQQRTFWVGPIVREINLQVQRSLCEKYKIGKEDFVVTSTVGGGGKKNQSRAFFEIVSTLHKRLYPVLPNLRHFAVLGPYSPICLDAQDGMTLLQFEPEMQNLFALSSLVIGEGGYNTVQEVRLAKTPAVFLPSLRLLDNQEERVRPLEKKGLCAVFTEGSPDYVAGKILEICLSKSRLDEMKTNYLQDHFETGNLAAAKKILELANSSIGMGI